MGFIEVHELGYPIIINTNIIQGVFPPAEDISFVRIMLDWREEYYFRPDETYEQIRKMLIQEEE